MAPAVTVEDLAFTYPRARDRALDGLTFQVESGEVFGLLGPNGAGKTTLQRILTGVRRGFQGQASVLDTQLPDPPQAFRERIGVAFETPNVHLRLTARENMALFEGMYREATLDLEELLESVGLADHVDERVSTYSKGMRMRLNLARSLLPDPDIWFLDEPTSGLDPNAAIAVRERVQREAASGRTVLLTTHDMVTAAEVCHRVAFIVEGQLALIGSPTELMVEHGEPVVEVVHGRDRQREQFPLEGLGEEDRFLSLLRSGDVVSIHSQEATLEDVFVAVTGRRLVA
ncbi:MAG: ABC transporter ATP-binding protein [Candidatus Thermoplasmatota archaeon]|nr:ABC transporter ATP-binding protein [Candidatus Thermoplasmatota archaeon]